MAKTYEETPDGFIFRRGLGLGAVLIGMIPFLVAIKVVIAGAIVGHLWIGVVAGIGVATLGLRLVRFFVRNKMHYLRLVRSEALIRYGVLDRGAETPMWEMPLTSIESVAIYRRDDPTQQLWTLAGVTHSDSGERILLDLLPFTQEYKRNLRKMVAQLERAGIAQAVPASLEGLRFESLPFYVPED